MVVSCWNNPSCRKDKAFINSMSKTFSTGIWCSRSLLMTSEDPAASTASRAHLMITLAWLSILLDSKPILLMYLRRSINPESSLLRRFYLIFITDLALARWTIVILPSNACALLSREFSISPFNTTSSQYIDGWLDFTHNIVVCFWPL